MNSIIKNTIKTILFAIPAISMIVVAGMYFPFITGKNFAFRIAVEMLVCLYIILIFADASYRPRWNRTLVTFTGFVGVIFLADIFAFNPVKAIFSNFERMEGFIMVAHLYVYYLVLVSVLKDKKDWIYMLFSTVAISVFMTIFAFLQFFGGATINQSGFRLDGTLGNSAYMATYMVFHIFFLIYLWSITGNKVKGIGDAVLIGAGIYVVYYLTFLGKHELVFTRAGGVILSLSLLTCLKIYWYRFSTRFARFEHWFSAGLYIWVILLQMIILYYTATRGATLGLIGGVVVTSLFIVFTEKRSVLLRRAAISIVAFIFGIIALFISFRNSDFVQQSPVLNRFASISLNDPTQARSMIWPIAIKAFEEHPIIGWGQDNFLFAFSKYYVPELVRHEPWFDRTHNVFLDWLVAGGILGFTGYILLYVFSVISLLKSTFYDNRAKAVLVGLVSAYVFLSMFIFDNLISYYLFVLLIGLMGHTTEESKERNHTSGVDGLIVITMIVFFCAICYVVNYAPYKQNTTLSQAITKQNEGYKKNMELIENAINMGAVGRFEALEQMDNITRSVIGAQGIPDSDKSDFVMKAYNEFNSYIKDNPNDVRGYYVLGSFLTDIGLYADAIPLLEKAQSFSPKKQQISYSLAKAYFVKSDREKNKEFLDTGLQYLKSAYELAPDMSGPRDIYLSALIATNRLGEVRKILGTISDPEESLGKNVIDLLKQNKLL